MTPVKDETILFLSLPRHDGEYNSTPWQLATQLAQNNQVIFADHPFTFLELITGITRPAIRKRIKACFKKQTLRKEKVEVLLLPFVWPLNFLPKGKVYNFFSQLNHRIVARRINRFLLRRQINSLIYINSFDFYFPSLDRFLAPFVRLKVYHCIDPMIKSFTLKHGPYLEQSMARQSDIIIATSPALLKKFTLPGFRNSYLVPNGAEVSFFSAAQKTRSYSHPKIDGIKGRILGYLGNIERRIDYTCLLGVIDRLPDWTLVMAGPVEFKYVPSTLLNHPRVVFTASIPYSEAPAMLSRFDVAIIPFICDEVSAGIYPLKMFEYLAAGKPVVSTNFNSEILEPLAEFICIAETPKQFAAGVVRQYATDSPAMIDKRMAMASQNSWQERAVLFGHILELETRNRQSHVA